MATDPPTCGHTSPRDWCHTNPHDGVSHCLKETPSLRPEPDGPWDADTYTAHYGRPPERIYP